MTALLPSSPARPEPIRRDARRWWRLTEVRWAVTATTLFALGGALQLGGAPAPVWWALYVGCCVSGGWGPTVAGSRALLERTLDVDLLMVAAAVAAVSIGQVLDAALLVVIFATSGALEAAITNRTADSVRDLLELAPERATRLDGHGGEELVDTTALVVGDVVLVRPGERIGADGKVVEGASEVDQSSVTGEPLPAPRTAGDEVYAGTVNGTGSLRVRVTRAAADSVVARIVAMVEEAAATKARTQLFVERVEQRYSVAVVLITLGLVAVPPALGAAFETTLLRAMTFMIVASPCAVVLATMPPLLASIANAGRHGVLVKSAVVMEQLGRTTVVAFDKTGTLTEGVPHVASVHPVPGALHGREESLLLAAGAEASSEHPVARAVVAVAPPRGLARARVEGFSSTPGRGVQARVEGHRVEVGSPVLLDGLDGADGARDLARGVEEAGHTTVVIVVDDVPAAVLALTDRLRDDAPDTVAALAALSGSPPVLLTGDNEPAARAVSTRAGVEIVHADLLPAGKVEAVTALQDRGHHVVLVGDGVNDAPALASADVGVAMGRRGADLSLQTADAVVVRDELAALPAVIALSRRARRVVTANLVIAATVIVCLVTWDVVGTLPLPLGVAGHEGSTVLVALNGLRLLAPAAWRKAARRAVRPRARGVEQSRATPHDLAGLSKT